MGDFMMATTICGILFIGLPWLVFHYVTKWKTAPKITEEDEKLLDDMFLTGSANAPTGGGVTSAIRLRFRAGIDSPTAMAVNPSQYETDRQNEVVGTGTLQVEPGYLGRRSVFKNVNRGLMEIYLSSFFAFKRAPKTPAK